jgi:hypothetical protein
MLVKERIQEVVKVRKARGGHELIKINGQGVASEVTEKLNAVIGQEVKILPRS